MSTLVLNLGSSSLKYALFNEEGSALSRGMIDGIGKNARENMDGVMRELGMADHAVVFSRLAAYFREQGWMEDIGIVVHRVVHGGESYRNITEINDAVLSRIQELFSLSPLHNPVNEEGIRQAKKMLPAARQYAVFDTAFYADLQPKAYLYGIPYRYYEQYRIRKYGFHGISHAFLSKHALATLPKRPLRHISCHLGNGSSITAMLDGKPLDTTMGFSPLQGLMMGTRSGTIDPSIVAFLESKENLSPEQINAILNKKSGILGISGISADVRDIYHFFLQGDEQAKLTLEIIAYQIRRFIGEMIAVLGGVDVISFSAGIGENAFYIRKMALTRLEELGIILDDEANFANRETISSEESRVRVCVWRTDEEREMFEQVMAMNA